MEKRSLDRHLNMPGALAFSVGTSVGWGSLVVTCNTYLAQAGPLGSVLGLAIGAVVMLIISRSYACLMKAYPEAGGAYSYTREVFGYDYGFLAAWFLAMTYLAILWANATSLPLFGRIFLGGFFKFGKLYTIFGYEVYIGEVLLSVAAIVLIGFILMHFKKAVNVIMIVLFSIFTLAILVCFGMALFGKKGSMEPLFLEDSSLISQIAKIAVISPWAFIGFESISHATEEFSFERKKIHRVLVISVIVTLLLYVFVTLLSVTAYPDRYGSWLEYIRDLDNLSGVEALPPFYAAQAYLGEAGVYILMAALLALVITSLIGNMSALSRLFYAMGKDHILPKKVTELNKKNIPSAAILMVVLLSVLVPLLGRTTIGWIVDVTTIGATLIYGIVSAAGLKMAREAHDKRGIVTGILGLVIMIFFGAYVLIPNFISQGTMAKETFLLFIIWSVLGFLFFRNILRRDREHRFGSSVVVWVALLSLVLFIALVWMRQSMLASDAEMRTNVEQYYETASEGRDPAEDVAYIHEQLEQQKKDTSRTMLMAMGMFGFVLIIMLTNHSYMNKRSQESEMKANTDSMTGVKNKHAFMVREKEIDANIRDEIAGNFAVVVCDVNGLKKINDTLGHKAGDEYIISACKMVCEIFQHSPVYRIGGDEFVAVLGGRDYHMRNELMRLLHDRSVQHIDSGGVVVSAGISDYEIGTDEDFHTVFARADELMYEEKKLLKSLGAVTRDDEDENKQPSAFDDMMNSIMEEREILNVRQTILIVDDEIINQQLLGNVLHEDYEILYANDGIEALERLEEHKEDIALIMLDLLMPRMGGVELIGRIKEDSALRHVPIIVLTADQKTEVECLQLGAFDFIPKPYPAPEIIKARVNKCIELSEDRNIIHSTERDSLTSLFNIEYFVRYVKLFDQHYQTKSMDAIVVDVNHFHMVNERYGKEYGDEVLKKIGEKVRLQSRKLGGVGCRQGADTFLIYAPHRDSYEDVLEKLSEGLGQIEEEEQDRKIRLRMGVYYDVEKSIDIERRFDRAKIAADTIKDNYMATIGVFDAKMHDEMMFNDRLLGEFKTSLEERQFSVFLQPKYDIRSDTPVLKSAEALVRWKHPELGMISPGRFIPLLEEHSLIFDLDYYVWDATAAYIRYCKDTYGFSVPVSVNVSRIDMLLPNLKEIFEGILQKYSLTTDDIILEITESAYTGDSDQVISMVTMFREDGFGIEMDDFGTGYSSLGMLSKLPIDALKLDMSFVRSAFSEKRDMRMIELIISIAERLDVPVIAEGVETEEQYLALKEMGCDIVQGYYFSKPVPKEEFDRFIKERLEEK